MCGPLDYIYLLQYNSTHMCSLEVIQFQSSFNFLWKMKAIFSKKDSCKIISRSCGPFFKIEFNKENVVI